MAKEQVEERQVDLIGEDWHYVGEPGEVPFENGWVNYNTTTYTPCAYYKDPSGMVRLKGLVKDGTMNTAIFTLPEGYRPVGVIHMVGLSFTVTASPRFRIYPTGDVQANVGGNGWMCLDHIVFRADN